MKTKKIRPGRLLLVLLTAAFVCCLQADPAQAGTTPKSQPLSATDLNKWLSPGQTKVMDLHTCESSGQLVFMLGTAVFTPEKKPDWRFGLVLLVNLREGTEKAIGAFKIKVSPDGKPDIKTVICRILLENGKDVYDVRGKFFSQPVIDPDGHGFTFILDDKFVRYHFPSCGHCDHGDDHKHEHKNNKSYPNKQRNEK